MTASRFCSRMSGIAASNNRMMSSFAASMAFSFRFVSSRFSGWF
jgi:hypothetical protein